MPFTPNLLDMKWTWSTPSGSHFQISTLGVQGPGGGGGTTNHAALSNLSFIASGHTGFAGTAVENTFTETQIIAPSGGGVFDASYGLVLRPHASSSFIRSAMGREGDTGDTEIWAYDDTGGNEFQLRSLGPFGFPTNRFRVLPSLVHADFDPISPGIFRITDGTIIASNGVYEEADGATITFDVTLGLRQRVTLGGNRTLAVANDVDGQGFTIILEQDGTGSRTVTWWAGIKWANATAPTLTTTANRYDVFQFVRLASGEYLGTYVLNFG